MPYPNALKPYAKRVSALLAFFRVVPSKKKQDMVFFISTYQYIYKFDSHILLPLQKEMVHKCNNIMHKLYCMWKLS